MFRKSGSGSPIRHDAQGRRPRSPNWTAQPRPLFPIGQADPAILERVHSHTRMRGCCGPGWDRRGGRRVLSRARRAAARPGCSARVWQAEPSEVWTLSRQVPGGATAEAQPVPRRCSGGTWAVTADRFTPGSRDGDGRGLCLSGQSPRSNQWTARCDPVAAAEWWCSVYQR